MHNLLKFPISCEPKILKREPSLPATEAEALVLVVEDDPITRAVMVAYLRSEAFRIVEAGDAAAGLALCKTHPVDLVLVDVNLPDASGFDLVTALRRSRDCAVIFTTARSAPLDKVRGLESGGDDYIVKPVEARELVARVRAVLRRYRRPPPGPGPADPLREFSGWILDLVRRELADPAGELIRLTRAEFDLLAALVQAGGQPLSRDYLIEVVASADSETKARTIDVMVSRIRRKLAAGAPPAPGIRTVQGQGYSFTPPLAS